MQLTSSQHTLGNGHCCSTAEGREAAHNKWHLFEDVRCLLQSAGSTMGTVTSTQQAFSPSSLLHTMLKFNCCHKHMPQTPWSLPGEWSKVDRIALLSKTCQGQG